LIIANHPTFCFGLALNIHFDGLTAGVKFFIDKNLDKPAL